MRISKGFKARTICNEFILTPDGDSQVDLNRIISMNSSARFLWENLQDKDFTVQDMVNMLLSEYEVSGEVALADCEKLVKDWQDAGILI